MNRMNSLCSLLLLTFGLCSVNLGKAQVFQKLHAYGLNSQTQTGEYRDVAWVGDVESIALVAVGTSLGTIPKGLVSINDPLGKPHRFLEFSDGINLIEGVAVDNAPNGDLIAVFFNAVANASEIARLDEDGNLLWKKRLPGIRAIDLKVAACSYVGGFGIWLTGYSTSSNSLAVEGLDANGSQVFAREYNLFNPLFSFSNSRGSEIEYDAEIDELVIVGYGQVSSTTTQAMLFTRLNLFGDWVTGTTTFDPFFLADYRGESLAKDPQMGKYLVALDYEVAGNRTFAACEVNYGGQFMWINRYSAGGVFSTNFSKVTGIDHFGPTVLMSGYYIHSSGNQRAMSMAIDPVGGPITLSTYPTNGTYPVQSSAFWGMSINPQTGHEYMAGNFRTPPTGGNWPQGNNPNSFYLVATDAIGQSACHDFGFQSVQALDPKVIENDEFHLTLPAVTSTPMVVDDVEPLSEDECSTCKRGLMEQANSESELRYRADRAINLELPIEGSEGFEIQLLDLQGKVLSNFSTQGGSIELPTQELAKGIYLVRFSGLKHSGVKKFKVED